MTSRILIAALAAASFATFAHAEKAEVAGKPALTTESTEALLAQRDKWGTEPSKSSSAGDKK